MTRKLSILLLITLFVMSCVSSDDPDKKAKQGAEIGAVAGAIAGAILGKQTGDPRTGAAIGAALGAGVGAAIGHDMDQQEKELQQIPGVAVRRLSQNEIDVQLQDGILFDSDSTALRSDARATLRTLAENFRRYPDEDISVDGHTDSIGSPEHKLAISKQRAESVRLFLIEQGVPESHVAAHGYADTIPRATNNTPEGRQMNRRVEIHVRAKPRR
ncbi:MAG TPA: OmpA family protein [Thermoanaerobaculia bacterium]|nr:OmpA family protein [Thermoanaerobaculia bacterium]